MTNTDKIRPYIPQDFEALVDAFKQNTPEYFDAAEIDDFINYLKSQPKNHYIIEVDGRVAGCSGYDFNKIKGVGQISWVFFHPDFHGLGLGQKLVGFCMDRIMENQLYANSRFTLIEGRAYIKNFLFTLK